MIPQNARSPSSAPPPSTTTMSVSSASPLKRRTEVPRRTVLRSVSPNPSRSAGSSDSDRSCYDAPHHQEDAPVLTVRNPQSSTSLTAQRRVLRPSCGRSSDKPNQDNRTGGSRPQPPCHGSCARENGTVFSILQWHELEGKTPPIERQASRAPNTLGEIWGRCHWSATTGWSGHMVNARKDETRKRHGTLSLYKCVTSDDGGL